MTPLTDKEIKDIVKNMKPIDFCKDLGCSDECIGIAGNTIWWKCRNCGNVTKTEAGPITI